MIQELDPQDGLKPYGTWRIWKNVILVSVAFMIHYVAANARRLGTKWAVCLSIILLMPSIACQMYPMFYTLIPSAFLGGVGGAPLWCAKCTYLAMFAEAHSSLFKLPSEVLLQRFLGFFYTIYQTNQIWGNLISSLVLSSGNNTAAKTSVNVTMIPQLCGANFLAQSYAKEALPKQPPEKIQMIAGLYLESGRKSASSKRSGLALLIVTVKQLAIPDQLLLLIITIFIGLHQAFFFADFSASFVSCAVGTGSVGYIMMIFGLSNAVRCFITGCVVKWIRRLPLFLGALFIHGGVFVTLLAWHPHAGEYYIMFIIAVLWGLCDSVWTVQINAYYGVLFCGHEEAAFSNFQLWEGSGQIISYVLSSYIKTRYKVYILICSMIVGVSGYLAVEVRQNRKSKRLDETK